VTARRLLSRTLDLLPGGQALKGAYRAGARPLQARARREIDRLQARAARFDRAQMRTLGYVAEQLDLGLSAEAALGRLREAMTPADVASLRALLDFVGAARARAAGAPARIVHARDLEPVASPERRTILFVAGEFPNPLHGGGARVADFIRLMSRDHAVHLFSVYTDFQDRAAYAALRPALGRVVTASYADFEATTRGLDAFADVGPIDVIHYEWPRALRHFRRSAAARHLFTCHEAVSARLLLDLKRADPDSPAWSAILVKLLTSLKVEVVDAAPLDACLTVTERDAAFLARFNPTMLYYVVNHGVTLDEFAAPDREPELRSLVYIGNYQHYPNEDAVHHYMREIDGLVRRRVPDARVYIVGANPTPGVLAYHDGERVIVTGPVPELQPAIQRAAVCIAPIVTGAGLRTKVVQYAALRRPAVVTSLAAADLLFEDGR
jgi:hypothetical protein